MDYATRPPAPFRIAPAPEAANAARDSTFIVYCGHGVTDGWDVRESGAPVNNGRVNGYRNANLPVVIGIGYFGETTVAQNNWGTDLVTGLLGGWSGPATPLGDLWLRGQRGFWKLRMNPRDPFRENAIGAARSYLTYMTFFGDPSLRILDDSRIDRFATLQDSPPAQRPPMVVANGDGRLEVYTLDRSGRVHGTRQTWSTPARTAWEDLGAPGDGLLAVTHAVNGDGRPELFGLEARTATLWHRWRGSTAGVDWSDWIVFDGDLRFAALPLVVRDDDGLLHLFSRTSDHRLAHRRQERNPSAWDGRAGSS